MDRPPLDTPQMEAALNAYYANREQAVRYVLAQLDPAAFDAPARPYREVLARVRELIIAEEARYAEEADAAQAATEAAPDEPGAAPATPQEPGV